MVDCLRLILDWLRFSFRFLVVDLLPGAQQDTVIIFHYGVFFVDDDDVRTNRDEIF